MMNISYRKKADQETYREGSTKVREIVTRNSTSIRNWKL